MSKQDNRVAVIPNKKFEITSPSQMSGLAKILKTYVVQNNLYTTIQGKNYVHVEGWQFAGGMLGLMPIITETIDLSSGNEVKWRATCDIIEMKSGKILGRGIAICSNKEGKKKSFDEYAVLSMAQTRAIGKAYRNLIGWTMKLAGYASTPAEEMVPRGETEPAAASSERVIQTDATTYDCHGVTKSGCPKSAEITKAEKDFSTQRFGKPLCRDCQKNATPKKK